MRHKKKTKQWLGTMARLHGMVVTVVNTITMVIKQIKKCRQR